MSEQIKGFEPIVDEESEIIILGSMPGIQSLQAGEYYAHKQNAFWKILNKIFPQHSLNNYEEKIAMLRLNNIALWDVLKSCERQGSLDYDIILKTMQVNDFYELFNKYPRIQKVCFNGAFAEKSYTRFVLKNLKSSISYVRLPSTSPAHASLSFDEKLMLWKKELKSK
ncbi:MAG: DNA-deoxyinosine glycosylase [Methylotenera sp.]|uniref:DNA-deoxyinosine glycosylase n=1 Tax=Methylotenera sp. TaxID=2051956 RepID=UPI0024880204|nr:DNA-deoxyinosine glycosylase [Methylotenera sp.]MDI1309873.1 DNA-deoxyinosine glycosylase [Methylotenera sp.]